MKNNNKNNQKECIDCFIDEYKKIMPRNAKDFNNRKTKSKMWQTIAKYNNVTRWKDLLEKLNLPCSESCNKKITVKLFLDSDF